MTLTENQLIDLPYLNSRVDTHDIDSRLTKSIKAGSRKIIVLDDDPTGIQTVHDVFVYTDWSVESIRRGFSDDENLFFILTNSRAFSAEKTARVHQEIARNIMQVSKELKRDFVIISRGDSTLRGHYPLETETLKNELEMKSGLKIDGEVLCPFFKEGGRYTINNVHYVEEKGNLIPAGKTEFAKDQTFGYYSSDLTRYIEEKTQGRYKAEDVVSISLEELRGLEIDKICEKLCRVENFNKVIVNAVDELDLKIFCIALYRAMAGGKRFLFRTAASFVKVFSGITDKALLTRDELICRETHHGGLIIIGSHTAKTTRQLEEVVKLQGVIGIEFDSNLVLYEEMMQAEINRTVIAIEKYVCSGLTVAVYTKRKVLVEENDDREKALRRSVKISTAVQSLVEQLSCVPNFIIAKGGITSSDIGTKALHIESAKVLGQIQPGVPVWQCGRESRFPEIPYIIFPGNVGEDDTLKKSVELLMNNA